MSKHILDRADSRAEGSRVKKFVEIERAHAPEGSSDAAKAAHRKAEDPESDDVRTREYLKIDRRQDA